MLANTHNLVMCINLIIILFLSTCIYFNRQQTTQLKRPKYPKFEKEMTRLKSFKEWSKTKPKPEAFSSAGFFYTGNVTYFIQFLYVELCEYRVYVYVKLT